MADTKFKPGQSGNPGGKPKRKPFRDALVRIIDEKGLDEQIMKVVLAKALKGDPRFVQMIWDRIEGKVKDDTEDGGNPVPKEIRDFLNGHTEPPKQG